MESDKLRTLLESTHAERAMVYKDLFALGCWLHSNGKDSAGRKLVKQVLASVDSSGNKTYLTSIYEGLSKNERKLAAGIQAHYEINALFQPAIDGDDVRQI